MTRPSKHPAVPPGHVRRGYLLREATDRAIHAHTRRRIPSGPNASPARTPSDVVDETLLSALTVQRLDWLGEGTEHRYARVEFPGPASQEVRVTSDPLQGGRWLALGPIAEIAVPAGTTWASPEEAMRGVELALYELAWALHGVRP